MRQLQQNRPSPGGRLLFGEAQSQANAKQQRLEQQANEKLTQLAQEQQRMRQLHPAPTPQQAAVQQQRDDQQLALLAVRNYRRVFLPELVAFAQQSPQLSPEAQQQLRRLNEHLRDKAWWKKQEGAQLTGKLKAYSDTLSLLTVGLLDFDLTTPPSMPAPLSVSRLNAQLATHAFDQKAANQLIHEAALSEKLIASQELVKAVLGFGRLSTAASSQELPGNMQQLREEVQASLRLVNKAMDGYPDRFRALTNTYEAHKALLKLTADYVATYGK